MAMTRAFSAMGSITACGAASPPISSEYSGSPAAVSCQGMVLASKAFTALGVSTGFDSPVMRVTVNEKPTLPARCAV